MSNQINIQNTVVPKSTMVLAYSWGGVIVTVSSIIIQRYDINRETIE